MAREEKKEVQDVYFSTGSTLMDLVVGGGEKIGYGMGYSAGTICRDWGGSSSTKTFKAVELLAANYHKYGDMFRWKYADIEHGNTIDAESLYGFDVFGKGFNSGREVFTVEDWEYDVNKFLDSLKPDERGIYILDSLDSLSSKEVEDRKEERHKAFDKDKEYDQGSYGANSAKFLSQEMFRGLSAKLKEKNSLLYVISQERDNLNAGPYGKKNRLGGGRAIAFYETVRVYSKARNLDERKGRAISTVIEVTAEKTRHPRPFRSCFIPIVFSYGIDNIGANIDFLFDLRSDKTGELLKGANSIEWDGEEMDRETLINFIGQNKLERELEGRVIDKWEDIEASIAVERPKKF